MVGSSITITPGVTTVTVAATGGVGGEDAQAQRLEESGGGGMARMGGPEALSVDDPAYSLQQETTEFLTQLSQGLSDENDGLIALVRHTLTTLRELQGISSELEHAGDRESDHRDGAASQSDVNNEGNGDNVSGQEMMQVLPSSVDTLSQDMDRLLDNLGSLLTSPNFIPIEEVTTRDEELARLRHGWEKMETRWREAIIMMDGWRRRMLSGGDTVNLEELKIGLKLGDGLDGISENAAPAGGVGQSLPCDDLENGYSGSEGNEEAELMGSDASLSSSPGNERPPNVENDNLRKVDVVPVDQPLRETTANVSPRKVSFATDPAINGAADVVLSKKLKMDPPPTIGSITKRKPDNNTTHNTRSQLPRKVSFIWLF